MELHLQEELFRLSEEFRMLKDVKHIESEFNATARRAGNMLLTLARAGAEGMHFDIIRNTKVMCGAIETLEIMTLYCGAKAPDLVGSPGYRIEIRGDSIFPFHPQDWGADRLRSIHRDRAGLYERTLRYLSKLAKDYTQQVTQETADLPKLGKCPEGIGEDVNEKLWNGLAELGTAWFANQELSSTIKYGTRPDKNVVTDWLASLVDWGVLESNGKPTKARRYPCWFRRPGKAVPLSQVSGAVRWSTDVRLRSEVWLNN